MNTEQPIDPQDQLQADARREQLARYIRGDFVFPMQRYDTREALEIALDNVRAANGMKRLRVEPVPKPSWVPPDGPIDDAEDC
jgi:hypothetical protein